LRKRNAAGAAALLRPHARGEGPLRQRCAVARVEAERGTPRVDAAAAGCAGATLCPRGAGPASVVR